MADIIPGFLEQFRRNEQVSVVWRCQHLGSQAQFDNQDSLAAVARNEIPQSEEAFRVALRANFDWGASQHSSCFLSVLNDRDSCFRWARQPYHSITNWDVRVYGINVAQFENRTILLRVDDLRARYGIWMARDTSREYLIIGTVPSNAFLEMINVGDIVHDGTSRHSRLEREAKTADEATQIKPMPENSDDGVPTRDITGSQSCMGITTVMRNVKS